VMFIIVTRIWYVCESINKCRENKVMFIIVTRIHDSITSNI